jgi:hypothetical protein
MISMFSVKGVDVREQTHTSQARAKSYATQDTLNVPLRSLFTQNTRGSASGSVSNYEDEEVLFPRKVPR